MLFSICSLATGIGRDIVVCLKWIMIFDQAVFGFKGTLVNWVAVKFFTCNWAYLVLKAILHSLYILPTWAITEYCWPVIW